MIDRHDFVLGARGWQYDKWVNGFYPEDLPEDWQLGFYSNEFHALLVPASIWMLATSSDVEDWLEDVHQGFCFYFEWSNSLILTSALRVLSQAKDILQDQLVACLYQGDDTHIIQSIDIILPVVIEASCQTHQGIARFSRTIHNSNNADILLVDAKHEPDLKPLRYFIEQTQSRQTLVMPALFVVGSMPSMGMLIELNILKELMAV